MVGNNPNFTKLDVLRCFLRLDRNVSRQELAKELELGEGTIRTILNSLKSRGLLDSTKKGHFLTKKGKELLDRIYNCIGAPTNLKINDIYPNLKKVGVLMRNMPNLRHTYKLRDTAVRNGAEAAMILSYKKRLKLPEQSNFNYRSLEKHFDFKDNDLLVVSFSNQNKYAENGALAVIVELNNVIKSFISEF